MTGTLAYMLAAGFVAPGLAIAGAAAVSVPILIHILSRRPRKPREWAAMRFLLAVYRKHRTRTRLEQLLLLLTRCALVLLLGLALAGPFFSALGLGLMGQKARTVILIIDNGITSNTADPDADGAPRLGRLKQAADQILAGLGAGDPGPSGRWCARPPGAAAGRHRGGADGLCGQS